MSDGMGFGVYGAYVWGAVGLFVVVVLANALAAGAALRGARQRAQRAQPVSGGAGR